MIAVDIFRAQRIQTRENNLQRRKMNSVMGVVTSGYNSYDRSQLSATIALSCKKIDEFVDRICEL